MKKILTNVKTSLQKYGIKYPVIQDNDYKIWNAYGNNYWPRMYLVDDKGLIRYDKIGEGEYNQTEKVIQSLLAERNSNKEIKIKNIDDINSNTYHTGINRNSILQIILVIFLNSLLIFQKLKHQNCILEIKGQNQQ